MVRISSRSSAGLSASAASSGRHPPRRSASPTKRTSRRPPSRCGEARGVGGDLPRQAHLAVASIAALRAFERREPLHIDAAQRFGPVARELVVSRRHGRPLEGIGIDALAHQFAEQVIHRRHPGFPALRPAENRPAESIDQARQDCVALGVGERAGRGVGAPTPRELTEQADGRVEPASHVSLGGQTVEIVAEAALTEDYPGGERRPGVLGRNGRGGEEAVDRAVEKLGGVKDGDDARSGHYGEAS